jgi:sulfotransferase
MRKIHYISGLPRSGSTLLTNILLQNPKFATTATSSLLDFLLQVRDNWGKLSGHEHYPEGQDKWEVIRAIMYNYHKTDKEIIFDKNRGWSTHIEFMEKATGEGVKIIACVRNLEDICSSFEKLFRKNRADGEIHGEFSNPKMKNREGRVGVWTSDEGVIGRPYISLLDTIQRGLGDRILFFPYEEWSSNPDFWFKKLYEFVGEDYYQHDFNNIEQTIRENDAGYGWGSDLHEIKKGRLLPAKSDAIEMLGRDWFVKLHDTEFWKAKKKK